MVIYHNKIKNHLKQIQVDVLRVPDLLGHVKCPSSVNAICDSSAARKATSNCLTA